MRSSLVTVALCVLQLGKSTASPAFSVVWNGPSQGCSHSTASNLTIADYGVLVNEKQSFTGSVITLMYNVGDWPSLNASYNATPCWSHHGNCSWNPWGDITAKTNGGVPQAANITLHVQKVAVDVAAAVPDPDSTTMLIVDWEAWRPLYGECDDGLSSYREYSARLVRAEPAWSGKNATAINAEAARRFDAGARDFFTATVRAIRSARPHVRIGFYSQGINQGNSSGGMIDNDELIWLWDMVSIHCV